MGKENSENLPEDQLFRQQSDRKRENHPSHHRHECHCHFHNCLLKLANSECSGRASMDLSENKLFNEK